MTVTVPAPPYYRGLNPVQLLRYINGHLEKLWQLADHPLPRPAPAARATEKPVSVTAGLEPTPLVR